ncbi:MAG: Lrp/AsnC family transcriptional regulator [Sphingomonadales bacterium]|nr:Lrp/AsnC family transcriptional regulator [Sphingomonadales bacterium]PIX67232.1 MAG: AsnC family transcriptional regulator [Sphingomonadales bacterium CG_4_10_14_3_um_filter_58_15]NCO48667.1 Lrp/AsnC family transcriptional regulator [Sphingomonadales bacterium]NCO99588.1 Lrp/AsnC family transcriptional regulator [Sphingomonadales bacterium]NCP27134.1 Lrp/AsnC family transcriptional regulator [Sphingomonadales bacterium]
MLLDRYEKKILEILQEDARISSSDLADKVGLSQSPCWRRVNMLEESGVIRKRVVLVDRKKVGLRAQVFAQVKLSAHGRAHLADFEAAIADIPEVIECYVLMGTVDFLLRVITVDIESYESLFFEKLSRLPGVQEITSSIALSEIKNSTALPIHLTE